MSRMGDDELSRALVAECLDGLFLWCWEREVWYGWTGKYWQVSHAGMVRLAIREWVRDNKIESADSAYRLRNLTEMVSDLLSVSMAEFDTVPFLLNCQNGTVNLRTKNLHPHDPLDLITRITSVDYIKGASHPDWPLALTALPDPSVLEWYQLFMGMAITGSPTPEGLILFQVGIGHNGKSSIMDAISATVNVGSSGYFLPASRSILAADRDSGPRPDKAALAGTHLAVIEELSKGAILPTVAIKDLADTRYIKARRLHENGDPILASHTVVVDSNFTPRVIETDEGTWRRLVMLRFPFIFDVPPSGQSDTSMYRPPDRDLKTRLIKGREQREAILAWLVEGAFRFYRVGANGLLKFPDLITEYSDNWRKGQDYMYSYITENVIPDPDSFILQTTGNGLRSHHNDWLASQGAKGMSAMEFNEAFETHPLIMGRGIKRVKVKTGSLKGHLSVPSLQHVELTRDAYHVWSGVRFADVPKPSPGMVS